MKLKKSELGPLANLIKKAFPAYTGRKFSVQTATQVWVGSGYWDGGSKEYYMGANLRTGAVSAPQVNLSAPSVFGGYKGNPEVPLPAGAAMLVQKVFCGKDLGITVYLNPEDFASMFKMLPETVTSR